MARLRSAPATQQPASESKQPTRTALREKTNTTSARALPSDTIKDFVKDARPTRARSRKPAQNGDELVMAGGLGQRSDALPSEAPMITDELAKSDEPPPPRTMANRRPPRRTGRPARSEAQSKVFVDMKQRMRGTAEREAVSDEIVVASAATSANAVPLSDALPSKALPTRRSDGAEVERSGFSISPSPPPPGKRSASKSKRSSTARPDSVLKSQSTPAAETSTLALKHFKRRPRQPSMLAMVQQRTASARPSAVHAQPTEVQAEDPSLLDIDGTDDDEEDFAPDAEGTPLHLRKARRTSVLSQKRAPSASKKTSSATGAVVAMRKRKSDEADVPASSVSALRAKRHKLSGSVADLEPTFDVSRAVERQTPSEREETPEPKVMSEVQVINSSPSTTPPSEQPSTHRTRLSPGGSAVVPSTKEYHQRGTDRHCPVDDDDFDEQVAHNETMADPISSSPTAGNPVPMQRTDIMAEPLTQLTPPRPRRDQNTGRTEKAAKAKPMMTATLQSLLPKRRQRPKPRHRKSEYDIDSDDDEDRQEDGSDSDEEEAAANRTRRPTKAISTQNPKSTVKGKTSAAARKPTAPSQSTRKPTAATGRRKTAASSKKTQAKTTKTYGRSAASDKENDPSNSDFQEPSDNDESLLPDTSLTMHEAAQSGELAAAKAKFAAVDGWDMEFESVSFEEGRSSSQTWR